MNFHHKIREYHPKIMSQNNVQDDMKRFIVFHILRDNTKVVYVGIVKCKINRNISGTPLDPKSFFEFS